MSTATLERPKASRNGSSKNGGPKVRIEEITPAKAAKLLAGNTHNRNVRVRRVKQLAGAIARGEWVLNGEPIQVAADGTLLNGQHRLMAVVEAEETISSLLVTGLENTAQETIDTGSARTIGDMLKARGYTDCNVLAAAARLVWSYENHGTLENWAARDATPQQVLATVEAHPNLTAGRPIARTIRDAGLHLSPSWSTGLHYLFSQEWGVQDAETFFVRLAYGDDLSQGDPIYLLRTQLLSRKANYRRIQPTVRAALTVKAFNAWCLGEKPAFLRWVPGGGTKEAFPCIVRREDVGA